MSNRSTPYFKAALRALHATGVDRLLAPYCNGMGAIFTGHQVTAASDEAFQPNRILQVTPDFLDTVIVRLKSLGFDLISLDDVVVRLSQAAKGRSLDGRRASVKPQRPFVCFTFDDGYRDNITDALPVFERHNVPLAIYIPTDYPDGRGELWWLTLEQSIRTADFVELAMDGVSREFKTGTVDGKQAAYHEIYWWLRGLPERRARTVVRELAESVGIDPSAACRELIASWDELRAVADHPLLTIGAHTTTHRALAHLPYTDAKAEMQDSIARIEDELATPCHHFSFPYGCEKSAGPREFELAARLGVTTAVTTRKALIERRSNCALTGLPRVSLNGEYQDLRYIETLLSGAPFRIFNATRKVREPLGFA
ncbi:MAG: polysaccharide deacetylase family protein [Pseudomonadota bacterium]